MAGAIAGGSLMLVLVAALKDTDIRNKDLSGEEGKIGLVQELGKVLFTDYVLPFEISSVLFLSAMVGAVVIGKKN
jgi:NADH-quinone oxidoreductase subunit J